MMQKSIPNRALTTRPLIVICSFQSGIRSESTAWILLESGRSNGSDISVPMLRLAKIQGAEINREEIGFGMDRREGKKELKVC